jgi:glycosyltransferase involved in cell wall biosynthesis
VAKWLQAADVFALATAREGCCNAVLEALAVGIPVVTTAAGDNSQFVRAGENGAIVPVDDVQATTDALKQCLGQKWNSTAISRTLVEQVGTWNEVAKRVIGFMRDRGAGRS